MKKIIIIVIPIVMVIAAAVYFLVIAAPPKKAETSCYSPGDSFITNIKDSTRLIKTTVEIEISSTETEKADAFLTEQNQKIRDIIIFTIRSKTESDLRSDDVKTSLCKELIDNLNKGLGIDYITNIYFSEYVIQ
jgi:flagellar basal body-associated protein FliL